MLTTQYYIPAYNKKKLYDLTPSEWESRIIIAQDYFNKTEEKVTKRYYWFKTHEHFINHLKSSQEQWFYEVFEDEQSTSALLVMHLQRAILYGEDLTK